jgi:16S rRNA processing protein RimM
MQPILIGKFGKTHGLLGCIRLHSYSQPPEQIFEYHITDKNSNPIKLLKPKDAGSYFLVKLPDVNDVDQASDYVNRELFISADQLSTTSDDEFYWHELIGCEVVNGDKISFGKVEKILNYGAQDILSIKNNQNKETLIPFTSKHVTSIDVANKLIVAEWTYTP